MENSTIFKSGEGEQHASKKSFKKKVKENISYSEESINKFIEDYKKIENSLKDEFDRILNQTLSITVEDLIENNKNPGNPSKILKLWESLNNKVKKLHSKFEDLNDSLDSENKNVSSIENKLYSMSNATYAVESYLSDLIELIDDKSQKYPSIYKYITSMGKKINENQLIETVDNIILNELSYYKFRKETKNRTNSEQLNKAVRQIQKKIMEINKIVDYTQRLKEELVEQDDLKKWKATENALAKIGEAVNHLNNKIKNLNQ